MQAAGGATVGDAAPAHKPARHLRYGAIRLFALIAGSVLLVDVGSKLIVVATLTHHEAVRLFGGLVYLVHTRNTGAAFSLASGYTLVLSLLAIGVAVFIVSVARRLASTPWGVALGLILGGAVGNLLDRIFRSPAPLRGGVVDFISLLDPMHPPWPVFNLADSALVVGVMLAVFLELRGVHFDGSKRLRGRAKGTAV